MADNSHALRVITKRARQKLQPAWSLSDRLNQMEMERDSSSRHQVLDLDEASFAAEDEALEPGDFPHHKADWTDVEGK